jgi:ABC-type glycerol-3-phosphate transport system permease component
VLGVLVLSLIGAHVFARMRFPFREGLYVALISVLMVPWVISFIPQYMIYHSLGMINTRWALIVPIFAHTPVLGIFILRAFLEGVPEEIYEAARCDGAGVWRQIFSISLPLSLPCLATIAVLSFVGTWNWFLWPLVVVSDRSKQLISVGLWRLQDDLGRIGRAGAIQGPTFAGYVIASLPLVLLFIFLGRYYVEGLVESGLKR